VRAFARAVNGRRYQERSTIPWIVPRTGLLAKQRSGELSCIGKPYLGASVKDLTIDDRIWDHRDTKALQDHGKRDFCHHGKRSADTSA